MTTDKGILKNYFKTKLKPTQEQFWAWMDSYWHKDESISIQSIDNLAFILDNKANAEHTHNNYATNDAESLTADNVNSWKKKLKIDELELSDAKVILGNDYEEFGLQVKQSQKEYNQVAYSQIQDRLKKPLEIGNTTNYPNVVGVDDMGNSAKLPAGDLGKNFSNTDLVVSSDRTHTGSGIVTFSMPVIFANQNVRYTNLSNKSLDATFGRFILANSTVNLNYADNVTTALTESFKKASDAQKDAYRTSLLKTGETYTTSKSNVYAILPPQIDNTIPYLQTITLTGNNMFVNFNSRLSMVYLIKVREVDNTPVNPINGVYPVEKLIENVSVHSFTPNLISFQIDSRTYPAGYYKAVVVNNLVRSELGGNLYINNNISNGYIPQGIIKRYAGEDLNLQNILQSSDTDRITFNEIQANTLIVFPIEFTREGMNSLKSFHFKIEILANNYNTGGRGYTGTFGLIDENNTKYPLYSLDQGGRSANPIDTFEFVLNIEKNVANYYRYDNLINSSKILNNNSGNRFKIYYSENVYAFLNLTRSAILLNAIF